jgi:hypothetical protein
MTNNLVGMDLEEGETITISSSNEGGAIVSHIIEVTGSENYYNGMAVKVNSKNTTYQGQGYAYWCSDNDFLMSATGGYFPAITGHQKKGLTWNYNLYTKAFAIIGSPDPGYEVTSVTVSYKDANGDVQNLIRNKEQLDESLTFEVQHYPTNVEATCETALKLADPTKAASKDNPYLITSVKDMVILSKIVNAKVPWSIGSWFKVADENAVFDFEGIEDFEPIGTNRDDICFMSSFDGNGVTIKNLHVVKDNSDYVGLFGSIHPNRIENTSLPEKIYINNIHIDSSCSFKGSYSVGSLAGYVDGTNCYLYIENCHNEGATVISTGKLGGTGCFAGGLFGEVWNWVTIANNSSWGDCTGKYAGGLLGRYIASRASGYSFVKNNQVGMTMPEGNTMTLTGDIAGSAVLIYRNNLSLSDNYYNGNAIVLKIGGKEYSGHNIGCGYENGNFSDVRGISCATSGYCGVTSENSGKNVEWKYDLYTKNFTVSGTGATADYTTSMAPSIVKDQIEKLTISAGVTTIGENAFKGLTNLNTITFDGCQLTAAAANAFDGCTAMAEGTVIINTVIPFGTGVGSNLLSIVTNGSLKCDVASNLKTEVERQGDSFLWKGGTFGTYQQELTIADISFGENKFWATYYSDENITTPDGVTAFVANGIEDNTVTVSAIDYIPANVGVLLYSETPGTIQKSYFYTGSEQSFFSMLKGSIDGMTLTKESGYILMKDEFVLTSGGNLAGHRCYLPIIKNSGKTMARTMSIGWGNIMGTTDIEAPNTDDNTTDDSWYTIDGRKLDTPPVRKGLYIHGRRKVIVK